MNSSGILSIRNQTPESIPQYFKRLRLRLTIGLIISFTVPYIILAGYFHYQFSSTMKNSSKINLAAIAETQKNTIDLFLQERVVNLFGLFMDSQMTVEPSQDIMNHFLRTLRQTSDSFVDVGFMNEEGIQIGYAGPFSQLKGKDYSEETWFKNFFQRKKNYFISDIYMGFRNRPHFTIATLQVINEKNYVMKATIDPDKFYTFLSTMAAGKNIKSEIINRQGIYQLVEPGTGKLLQQSDYIPSQDSKQGVYEINTGTQTSLIAYKAFEETDWILLVKEPFRVTHGQMYTMRILITSFLFIILITFTIVIYSINKKLIHKAQASAENSLEMQNQLFHASKLASIGELATGVAHEINNPLAIITATTGLIKDMLSSEYSLDSSPENIIKELENIDTAAYRASGITNQLLTIGRKKVSKLLPCNINQIIDESLKGINERTLYLDGITLNKNYTENLPELIIDPDQMRQVFINLVNNAHDAISGSGTITISTGITDDGVRITLEDTGMGMEPEHIKQIFNPFFTTKEVGKGTGLGLSVSLNIIESFGGSIDVQSIKGHGSVFTIILPLKKQ